MYRAFRCYNHIIILNGRVFKQPPLARAGAQSLRGQVFGIVVYGCFRFYCGGSRLTPLNDNVFYSRLSRR